MSDHYSCSGCGRRYDECCCPSAEAAALRARLEEARDYGDTADACVRSKEREIQGLCARIAELEAERDAAQSQCASAERDLNDAWRERDAAVRARAEVEAKLEGVRAALKSDPEDHWSVQIEDLADVRAVLDAHPSDALRAFVEKGVRAGVALTAERSTRAEVAGTPKTEERFAELYAAHDDRVLAIVARVLGGGL